MTLLLTLLGVGLVSLSGVPYIRALMAGRVRPRLVSWVLWTVIAGITTLAALQEGQVPSALVSMVAVVTCGTIVALGWRQGSKSMTKLDIVCAIGAVVGIGVFVGAHDPLLALAVSLVVDAVAFVPTFVHGWRDPEEESLRSFVYATLGQAGTVAAALSVGAALTGLLYPVYALVFNGAMVVILLTARTPWRSNEAYGGEEA